MQQSNEKKVAQFLYEKAISQEIYPLEPDGESLAILEMLSEIRKIGYPFYYFADIRLRSIKDPRIMEIMMKYYPRMESIYTKSDMLEKIDPVKFPEAFDFAYQEYEGLSPLNKLEITGFQKVLSKGKADPTYINKLLTIMDSPDNYASSFYIRNRLLKIAPHSLRSYSMLYSKGVLLPLTLKDFSIYKDAESLEILTWVAYITESEIQGLYQDKSYKLCITMYEYWKKCCTLENLHKTSATLLKSIKL